MTIQHVNWPMTWRIASVERRRATRDGRLILACSFLAVLLAFSGTTAWLRYSARQEEHLLGQRAERERWLDQGLRNPHLAAHQGIVVFRPVGPLSVLDDGINPFVGQATHLEAETRRVFSFKPLADGPLLKRLGRVTSSFTLQVLVPFVLVLVCYAAVVEEREHGTLRQLLATGVGGHTILAGKLIGWGLPLLIVLGVLAVVGGAAIVVHEGARLSPGRWVLLSACYFGYWSATAGVCITMSTLLSPPRHVLVALLGAWTWACLLAPQVAITVVQLRHPAPTGPEFAAAVQADKMSALMQLKDRGGLPATEQRYALDRATARSAAPRSVGMELQDAEDARNQVFAAHFERLYAIYRAQEQLYELASALSPTIAMASLSMAVTATDIDSHHRFEEAAEGYRQAMVSALNDDIAKNRTPDLPAHSMEYDYVRGRDLWESIPAFDYQPPDLLWNMAHHWRSAAALGGWVICSLVAIVVAGTRLRVD